MYAVSVLTKVFESKNYIDVFFRIIPQNLKVCFRLCAYYFNIYLLNFAINCKKNKRMKWKNKLQYIKIYSCMWKGIKMKCRCSTTKIFIYRHT